MEEPRRKSFLDVVRRNLAAADRPEHVTRYVYVGCYKGAKDELHKLMKHSVEQLNVEYGKIVLTGFFLVYPRVFLHLIEASEEIIYRHLQAVLTNSSNIIENAISLPAQYNVYKMYFSEWYTVYTANPPVLLDKIEIIELEEICKQIKNCLFKMYSLCEYLMDQEKISDVLNNLSKVVPYFFPEVTTVEYLLSIKSPVLEDLRIYLMKFSRVPFIQLYNDSIWPPVWSFVPRSLHSSNKKQP